MFVNVIQQLAYLHTIISYYYDRDVTTLQILQQVPIEEKT